MHSSVVTIKCGSVEFSNRHSTAKVRRKGKSLLDLPDDYTVIDIETTGLDAYYDDIIEIGCIRYRNNAPTEQFHTFLRPCQFFNEDGSAYYIDDFITDLTGITDEMVKDAPAFKDVAPKLIEFLGDDILVGHNINFDINFIYDNMVKNDFPPFKNDFVDTMRISRKVLPDLPHHRLTDLTDYFKIEGNHHRSLDDCALTNSVYQQLRQLINENHIDIRAGSETPDLRALVPDAAHFDKSHPFYGRRCVFTGKLNRFSRKEAAQIVVNIGGLCENNVTKKTNYLIVGGLEGIRNMKGGKTTKIKKAEKLILSGQDLQILSENAFYDYISEFIDD